MMTVNKIEEKQTNKKLNLKTPNTLFYYLRMLSLCKKRGKSFIP